jgi:hypothetical protein
VDSLGYGELANMYAEYLRKKTAENSSAEDLKQ